MHEWGSPRAAEDDRSSLLSSFKLTQDQCVIKPQDAFCALFCQSLPDRLWAWLSLVWLKRSCGPRDSGWSWCQSNPGHKRMDLTVHHGEHFLSEPWRLRADSVTFIKSPIMDFQGQMRFSWPLLTHLVNPSCPSPLPLLTDRKPFSCVPQQSLFACKSLSSFSHILWRKRPDFAFLIFS